MNKHCLKSQMLQPLVDKCLNAHADGKLSNDDWLQVPTLASQKTYTIAMTDTCVNLAHGAHFTELAQENIWCASHVHIGPSTKTCKLSMPAIRKKTSLLENWQPNRFDN